MTPALTAGLGLKPAHFDEALGTRADGLWFEVHPENYLVDGGPRRAWLDAVRDQHPLSLHGVSMSLAGHEAPDPQHLQRLAALVRQVQPALVSEHLAWCRLGTQHAPDLLPFPRTHEALHRIAGHVARLQDTLQVRVAIENPSHYLHLPGHAWDELDFLHELVRRTGCGLLVDVNNLHVSACNTGLDAIGWLDRVDADAVMEIHLAGHREDPALGAQLLIDSHDAPVAEPVWALHARLVGRIGPRPTLIERDDALPAFGTLMDERRHAHGALVQPRAEAA
jgi:uncharacterized protein (UPF0276 family)